MKNYYVTKEHLEELKKRLEKFKKVERFEVAERLEHAKSMGDLSENIEYSNAREEQMKLETQIVELEDFIKNAVIIKKQQGQKIALGSTILVACGGKEKKLALAGSDESDPERDIFQATLLLAGHCSAKKLAIKLKLQHLRAKCIIL